MKKLLIASWMIVFTVIAANAQKLTTYRPGMVFPADYTFTKDTLVVMAFNTENFTDTHDNPYISNQMEDNAAKTMEGREALLIKAFKAANADVVMVSEFETIAYLREINQKYGLGYKFFASSESQTWYQNTMLMSKVPIGTFRTYGTVYSPVEGETDKNGMPLTQTNINARMWIAEVWPTASRKLYLCGVHLKAGRNKSDTATRIGQFTLLKGEFDRILKEDENAAILMAGDFNATPESAEFRIMQEGNKMSRMIDPLAGTQVFSHPAKAPRWRIDHMLYNEHLKSSIVPGTTGPVYLLSKEEMEKLSDHLPLMTKILIR